MKRIYIRASHIDGKGIIAGENIRKDEVIQRIKGKKKFFVIKNKQDSLANPDWVGIERSKWIDPDYPNKYLNHSCNPNSGIKGKVTIIALRNINKDEEITIDYSTTECDELWEMKCTCGEKNCRKIIRSIQYLPEKQFTKYLPYVTTYFKNLYLKEHPQVKFAKA